MTTHKTTIHARCPYAPIWDYYTVTVTTPELLRCEDFQAICDEVRGQEMTQEDVFAKVLGRLPLSVRGGRLTIKGRHGQNGRLVISESW